MLTKILWPSTFCVWFNECVLKNSKIFTMILLSKPNPRIWNKFRIYLFFCNLNFVILLNTDLSFHLNHFLFKYWFIYSAKITLLVSYRLYTNDNSPLFIKSNLQLAPLFCWCTFTSASLSHKKNIGIAYDINSS